MRDVAGSVTEDGGREPETGRRRSAAAWRAVTGNGQHGDGACVVGE